MFKAQYVSAFKISLLETYPLSNLGCANFTGNKEAVIDLVGEVGGDAADKLIDVAVAAKVLPLPAL